MVRLIGRGLFPSLTVPRDSHANMDAEREPVNGSTGWQALDSWLQQQRTRLAGIAWQRPAILVSIAVLALLWAYWPTLADISHRWATDPQYSHGFLVPIFAAIVLWVRRDQHADVAFEVSPWGLVFLAVGGVFRIAAAVFYFDWLDALSLIPTLTGVCLLLIGMRGLRWAWPAVLFLVFMLPAPYQLEVALAHPLQSLATTCSTYLLQTMGLPAIAEGNIIRIDEISLGVEEACSGLGMLITFFALSTAFALVIRRHWVQGLIVFMSAIPIAVVVNILRITLTGALWVTAGSGVAKVIYHDLAGWLMMPLALLLMWLELKFMDRVWLRAEEEHPLALGLAPGAERPRPAETTAKPLSRR